MLVLTFLGLQVLDFLTTIVGLKVGAAEASPMIRALLALGVTPAMGVAGAKIFALALGGICVAMHRHHVIRWINYWYAALVVWNVTIIVRLVA